MDFGNLSSGPYQKFGIILEISTKKIYFYYDLSVNLVPSGKEAFGFSLNICILLGTYFPMMYFDTLFDLPSQVNHNFCFHRSELHQKFDRKLAINDPRNLYFDIICPIRSYIFKTAVFIDLFLALC